MILVDMNQVTLSNLMVQIGSKNTVDPDLDSTHGSQFVEKLQKAVH